MNILEIGTVTGDATTSILEVLGGQNSTSPRCSNHTFTDIRTESFEKAHEKLKPWLPYMTVRELDVEQDPIESGCALSEYDLNVTANVLQATSIMDAILSNVKKPMKLDANLIMSETTHLQYCFNMIVGSFDGWWTGKDDGRQWGSTILRNFGILFCRAAALVVLTLP